MDYPEMIADRPSGELNGVYVGIVTDNEDPEDLARVKVTFPWRDADDESTWARIATPMAGKQMGQYFLPEVDDEVLVAFENGDIHEPYVIGGLWNGDAGPPEKNSDGENNHRSITSRADHEILLDDTDDTGKIKITTGDDRTVVFDDDNERIEVTDNDGTTVTIDSKGVTVDTDSSIKLSGKDIELSADKGVDISGTKVKVKSKSQTEVSSKGKLAIDSTGMMDIGANGMLKMQSSGILTIKGSLIQLN